MNSPGVTVRPLVMSTGDAEFGEVFFDDVLVPKANVIGDLHGGWRLAMHTLAHERGPYAMTRQVTLSVTLDRLVAARARCQRDGAAGDRGPGDRARRSPARDRDRGAQAPGLSQRRPHDRRRARRASRRSVDKLVLARGGADARRRGARALCIEHALLPLRPRRRRSTAAARRSSAPSSPSASSASPGARDGPRAHRMTRPICARSPASCSTPRGDLAPARAFADGDGDAGAVAAELGRAGLVRHRLDDDDPFGIPGLCLLAEQARRPLPRPTLLVDTAVAARLGAIAVLSPCGAERGRGWTAGPRRRSPATAFAARRGVAHAVVATRLVVVATVDGEQARRSASGRAATIGRRRASTRPRRGHRHRRRHAGRAPS